MFELEKLNSGVNLEALGFAPKVAGEIIKCLNLLESGQNFTRDFQKNSKTGSGTETARSDLKIDKTASKLLKKEVYSTYEIHYVLRKLNINIHPRDILYLIIKSKVEFDLVNDKSLTLEQVLIMMKKSIYKMIKQKFRIYDSTAIVFVTVYFYCLSVIQKFTVGLQNELSSFDLFTYSAIFIFGCLVYIFLKSLVFSFQSYDFSHKVDEFLKEILKKDELI